MSKLAKGLAAGLIGLGVVAGGGVAFAEATKATTTTTTKVNLNTATEAELEALPGVGPANAKKIVAGRPYSSVDDLSKAGISAGTIKTVRNKVTTGAEAPAVAPAVAASPVPSKKTKASHKKSASSEPTAPAATAPAPARPAATPAPTVTGSTPAQAPPAKGMVWVNTKTRVFHREGDEWYGKTKEGKFMTEAEALAAGFHEAKVAHQKQQ
jgi:Helix-hairpin-helix motif